MRGPNDPIPGFEDEFTGKVGREKRIHKYLFDVTWHKPWKSKEDEEYEWVEFGPGKSRRVRRTTKEA